MFVNEILHRNYFRVSSTHKKKFYFYIVITDSENINFNNSLGFHPVEYKKEVINIESFIKYAFK